MWRDEGEPGISFGTSFSTPFVSAIITNMIGLMKHEDLKYTPSQVQNAIMNTAEEVDVGDGQYINAGEALKQIGRRKGIEVHLRGKAD